jgi:hypothetical protein
MSYPDGLVACIEPILLAKTLSLIFKQRAHVPRDFDLIAKRTTYSRLTGTMTYE